MKINFLEEELRGKTVIITGGNKGIGRGCAKVFCTYGAHVIITARDEAKGLCVADELTRSTAGTCEFIRCDVSQKDEVEKMILMAHNKLGRIDCLINNAGYLPFRRPLDLCTHEDMQCVMETNFMSVFNACKFALPYLRYSKGNIINMSSVLANSGQEGSGLYSSTKGAIISFSKSLAIDEARNGVRVNTVLPGAIKTGIEADESSYNHFKVPLPADYQSQWIERCGEPEEIGTVCLFLSSSWASYVNGAEILVDGGFMLGNGNKIKMFDWNGAQKVIK